MAAGGDVQVFTPIVYWGQNKEKIFLKVDICDITNGPEIDLTSSQLTFKAHGTGARGPNFYTFTTPFHLSVDTKRSKYKVTGRCVEFEISKAEAGDVWPRLVKGRDKLPWVKADFDHFTFEDSDMSETEDSLSPQQEELMSQLERDLKAAESSVVQDLRKVYLFTYNLFQWLGYSYIFFTILYNTITHGWEWRSNTYSTVGGVMRMCQCVAVLEVIHPLLGWVKSGVLSAFIQVFGRGLIIFGILAVEERLHKLDVVWYLFLAYSSVEVIRYPYYILAVIDKSLSVVTWLRYTAWIPLYPIGFMCEGTVVLLALPLLDESGAWCFDLPNSLNCSFHFPTFLRINLITFMIGMYTMMQHMYQIRKKKLNPPSHRLKNKSS